MTASSSPAGSRREFLSGQVLRHPIGSSIGDESVGLEIPRAGDTLRVQTRAMACQFAIFLDADRREDLAVAGETLDDVHRLEAIMTVYRTDSELSAVNALAAWQDVELGETLFDVLGLALRVGRETDGAFDVTSGPLVALWREGHVQGRIPAGPEIESARRRCGLDRVRLDRPTRSIRFDSDGVEVNLGGIGKGFALDRIGERLVREGVQAWLAHGGHSSLLAHGPHAGQRGWPVGIRHPLFPTRRWATIQLTDRALSTSGSGVDSFRIAGRRFGHILDPRDGVPVEGMLSVTVLADSAAEADALSTAFFVRGVEFARAYCDNRPEIAALLIPTPRRGQTLEPVVCGLSEEELFFE